MRGRARVGACLLASLVVSLIGLQACGDGGGGSSGCGPQVDTVTVNDDQITVSSTAVHPPTCQVLATPDTQIVANSGGAASTQFWSTVQDTGYCVFKQLLSLSAAQKTAYFSTRSQTDVLFTETNGSAECTVNGIVEAQLCGQASIATDGTQNVSVVVDCNNDPAVDVAVYRGGATLTLNTTATPVKVHVGENDKVTSDLKGVNPRHSVPQFSAEQTSVFDTQLDALVNRVSLSPSTSLGPPTQLLRTTTLSPSNVVVAPNVLQGQLVQNYGRPAFMCQSSSSTPVVFYPVDPNASTPRIYGSVCGAKTATVYGVATYRASGYGFSGPYFKVSGGTLIRSDTFASGLTLVAGAPRQAFAWDGRIGESPLQPPPSSSSTFARKDVYVLKFLYELPPDMTPRIGYVAVSLFGAPYPVQIG